MAKCYKFIHIKSTKEQKEVFMALLKNNLEVRNKLKGDFSTILGELDEIEENDAIDFIKWMEKSAKYTAGLS